MHHRYPKRQHVSTVGRFSRASRFVPLVRRRARLLPLSDPRSAGAALAVAAELHDGAELCVFIIISIYIYLTVYIQALRAAFASGTPTRSSARIRPATRASWRAARTARSIATAS